MLFLVAQGNTLSIRDLADLTSFLNDMASQWQLLGLKLGFSSGNLKNIQNDPLLISQGAIGYLTELLAQWLKWAPPKHSLPTIDSLAAALQGVKEERLAYELLKKVPGQFGSLYTNPCMDIVLETCINMK